MWLLDDFGSLATSHGANMIKAFSVVLLLLLAGCSGVPQRQYTISPCSHGEVSYACQIERYHNVNAQ
jgi:uncharacterized lipoprotein YmbA